MISSRSHHKERLDDLPLEGFLLTKTLKELTYINLFLGNSQNTVTSIQKIAKKNQIQTIVDLGCGGGDNLRSIRKWFRSKDKKVRLIGIDGNKNSLEYAKKHKDFEIEYIQEDILSSDFQIPKCDVLISSHFIYHFSDQELIQFLKSAKEKINTAIVFSELQRSKISYTLFKFFGFLMPFSKMVKQDGLLTIRRSFTRRELENILKEAGINEYSLRWKWWFRFILIIPISSHDA